MIQIRDSDATQLYEELRRRLRRDPAPEAWSVLADEGWPEMVAGGSETVEEALKRLQRLERAIARAPKGKPRPPRVIRADARAAALHRIRAIEEAPEIAELTRFRQRVLNGRLRRPDRADGWVRKRERAQGGDGKLRPGWRVSWWRPLDPPEASEAEVEANRSRPVLVKPRSELDQLYRAAEACAEWFEWPIAQAAAFVLTGVTPTPPLLQAEVSRRAWGTPTRAHHSVKILLTVDPRVQPADVARLYARLRREEGEPRTKNLSAKHAELAVFAAEINDGRSWGEAFDAWNQQHREWRYDYVQTFTRDARQGYERVTGRRLSWKGAARRRRSET